MKKLWLLLLAIPALAQQPPPVVRDLSCVVASGAANTYACSIPTITAYVTGTTYRFKANVANTGSSTWNLNGLGAIPLIKTSSGAFVSLAAGDIVAGQWVLMTYDGTSMQTVLGGSSSGPGTGGITQLTGDGTAGPGTGSQVFTLTGTGAVAGTYTNVTATVDAKGRILSISNGAGPGGGGVPNGPLSGRPAVCATGDLYLSTDQSKGIRQLSICGPTSTWTIAVSLTGGNILIDANGAFSTNPATVPTYANGTIPYTGRMTDIGGFNCGNETLSWSSTVAFSAVLCTTNVTLLGNMAFTIPNGTAEGDEKFLTFDDTPGGSVVTAPANVLGFVTPGLTAGTGKTIPMVWDAAATKWRVTGGSASSVTIVHQIVGSFNGSGTALSTGQSVYMVAPFSCTIQNWTILVDSGTATVDVWKIASTSALPTVANTITASANPAISTGVKTTSSTLTGWTTAVTAGDTLAVNLKTLSGPTLLNFSMACQ